jgi:peptidoglycan/LPS O-acetylase OafA/YrhL
MKAYGYNRADPYGYRKEAMESTRVSSATAPERTFSPAAVAGRREEADRLGAVDGLRGLAILMVIYQHAYSGAVGKLVVQNTSLAFPYLTGNGWMGVGLFFVLSGFVLSLPYFSGQRSMEGNGIRTFYAHRANRLIPLFVFMAFIGYSFAMAAGRSEPLSLFLSLTTLTMFRMDVQFFPAINGAFWTLFVEIWFCVLFPFLVRWALRYGIRRVLMPVLVVAFAFRFAGAYVPFVNIHANPVKDFVLARMDDFFVGMVVAWFYAHGQLPRLRGAVLIGIGCLLASAFLWDLRVQDKLPLFVVPFLNNFAQIGFAALLIAALSPETLTARVLSLYPLRILGVMCFSLYLWHVMLLRPSFHADPFSFTKQIEFWGTLLALSAFTFRYIEFPQVASVRKLFRL